MDHPPPSTTDKLLAAFLTLGFMGALIGMFIVNLSHYNGALDSWVVIGDFDEKTKHWLTRGITVGLFFCSSSLLSGISGIRGNRECMP
jgi:small-conductance mechanosensitive channel